MQPVPAAAPLHRVLDLAGTWTLTAEDGRAWPARVPGCVHQGLMDAGVLPPLWWRDNELQHQWPADRAWVYEREVDVDADLLAADAVLLRCEGLDTLAEVAINGTVVGNADNMHRTWVFDAKPHLRVGANTIRIRFAAILPVLRAKDAERHLPAWNTYHQDFRGKSWLRKMACSFGWDWGPMAPTAGIWRGISLHVHRKARLDDVRIVQTHHDGDVDLAITSTCTRTGEEALRLRTRIFEGDRRIAEAEGSGDHLTVTLRQPRLWWPNGQGDQVLHRVEVDLLGADGSVIDTWSRRIGLRDLRLVREEDQWGESFAFSVNGRRIFAKGANWIPCDVLVSEVGEATYRDLLGSARDSGMNMIRCWGGGIYEHEAFYDCCDEFGLLVWQDFMFACATYPTFDPAFLANVEAEAVDNVRRLRHHPCIALWCGNNELEQGLVDETWTDRAMSWSDYAKLFDRLLPDVVAREHGEAAYWPCSPHTPYGDRRNFNNDRCGDAHAWSVWFGGQSFESQRTWTYRFQSEFGFQSFPEPRTIAAFTEPEDRHLNSFIMDYHQRSKQQGNSTIFRYLLEWFHPPRDLDRTLWLSQLTQALCVQYAAEHSRRIQPRMEGCVYWQINDCWPAATWSSIDVFGRWKALQYFATRFFAPVLVSGLEDLVDHTVAVHVSNHRPESLHAEVRWRVSDCAGEILASGDTTVTVPPQRNLEATIIPCRDLRWRKGDKDCVPGNIADKARGLLGQYVGDRDLLVWMEVVEGGVVLSRNLTLFARPKHLDLRRPEVTTEVSATEDGGFAIRLASDVPALWTRLELADTDARFSDNFLHLDGRTEQIVICRPKDPLGLAQVRERLRVESLADTY